MSAGTHGTTVVALPSHDVHALTWGPDDGPLLLALHGFPDTAWTFRHLGPLWAAAGWRVVAPFLRGYGPSGVPRDDDYTVGALMADAVALHARLDGDARAVLVGHDWGAVTANGLGADPASPFARVVALAIPPLPTMNPGRGLLRPWLAAVVRQPRKSWYVLANQVPGVSERVFARLASRLWHDWSPGYDARTDLAHLLESVPDLERARAVVSYYRAAARPSGLRHLRHGPPLVPTLYLHGAQDGCLDRRFFDLAAARLTGEHRAVQVEDAGHFLTVEQPDVVAAHVLAFLDRP
ncbi:alpha/beta fold hydrolase [Nocardioides sp.]|uniref:alpha/beta fold hydrolase n=1 Tax=Nocardioides sp. TaxID=35761 RepID=UPI0027175380|nr:alpha/beta hydrolase [Nocardioides sp.]MDO9456409.1 alpha/beta hydrolase [Nocardioides sp.]